MIMKKLVIVGARGFGREVSQAILDCQGYGREFILKGFLDSDANALDGFNGYAPILASPEKYEIQSDDVFFVALGDVKWRRHYAEVIESRGGGFRTLVHNEAHIGKNVSIDEGAYFARGVSLTVDIAVGRHTFVFDNATVGHDCQIGDYCHLSVGVFLGGGVTLGNSVTLHPGVKVAPHKRMGDESVAGIGSVVIQNVRAGTTVFGNPAQRIDL